MSGTTRTAERPPHLERRLPPVPTSVGTARRLIEELLVQHERVDLVDTATLLVSEVVTNALLHAGTHIEVVADLDDDGLLVEVGDGSMHHPTRRRYAHTAGTGRGMVLLESLVDAWGVDRRARGKSVWFRVSRVLEGPEEPEVHPIGPGVAADRTAEPGDDPAGGGSREGPVVEVVLLGVPLLLHSAWQCHVEALLRDYLLASMVEDEPASAIALHAGATDAIAVLEEHLPRHGVTIATDAVMTGAEEPAVTVDRVVVPVPRASLASFVSLGRAVESAVAMAESGEILTPPTQPELRLLRRWLVEQVRAQAAGEPPTPWSAAPGEEAPALVADPGDAEAAEVRESPECQVLADDRNRILAVSGPALELLGHADEDALVGHRVVDLVPERLRQAHLAGFTMYLVLGRQPLVDTWTTVPAVRADGSELPVQLRLTALPPASDGRTRVLADLRPSPGA